MNMNNIQYKKRIPNKVKKDLFVDGEGIIQASLVIQGIMTVVYVIIFGLTEFEGMFTMVTTFCTLGIIGYILAFSLYALNLFEIHFVSNNRDTPMLFLGFLFSPIGLVFQLIFSSIFSAIYYWSEDLPGWETQLSKGFSNPYGFILGVLFILFIFYTFFMRKNLLSSTQYNEAVQNLLKLNIFDNPYQASLQVDTMIYSGEFSNDIDTLKDIYIEDEVVEEEEEKSKSVIWYGEQSKTELVQSTEKGTINDNPTNSKPNTTDNNGKTIRSQR